MSQGDQLRAAAEAADVEEVERLLDAGCDINDSNRNGYTALHWASRDGNEEVVELLLKRGADTNVRDYYQRTPLHYASREGKPEIVKLLCDNGADICAKDQAEWSPYRYAQYMYDLGMTGKTEKPYKGHDVVMQILRDLGGDLCSRL